MKNTLTVLAIIAAYLFIGNSTAYIVYQSPGGDGGGDGIRPPEMDTVNGVISTNDSISGGNLNVTGQLQVDNSFSIRRQGSISYLSSTGELNITSGAGLNLLFSADNDYVFHVGGNDIKPLIDNSVDLGTTAQAFRDITYEGSLIDTDPSLAEAYYYEQNKSFLDTELKVDEYGRLIIDDANPYLYTQKGNETVADIGEATIDNALKIGILKNVIIDLWKANRKMRSDICNFKPNAEICTDLTYTGEFKDKYKQEWKYN